MELVKFEQFGLNENEAKEITKDLPQILAERDVLSEQYNEVIRMDIEDKETSIVAKNLKKLIRDNRTKGIEIWHKTNKEYFLRGGQFVDAIKRKEIAENNRMEDALEEIEKYHERKENERLTKLNNDRINLVAPYLDDTTGLQLALMEQDVFEAYLTAKKTAYEKSIEEEKRIEEERLEAERKEKEEIERIRLENEKLKKEAEENEAKLKTEKEERERKELEEAKKRAIEEAKKQAEIDRIKAELEAERKKEQERIEKEKAELEAKFKAEKDAKKAPEKDKILNAIDSILLPELDLKELENQYIEIKSKLEGFKKWAKSII